MSIHAVDTEVCEVAYIDDAGTEFSICLVAIGTTGVFGCPGVPTVSGVSRDYTGGTYQFVLEDFTTGFSDPNGDSYLRTRITVLPEVGSIQFDGVDIAAGYELPLSDVSRLTYVFPVGYIVENGGYTDDLGSTIAKDKLCVGFQTSDDSDELLFSNEANTCLLLKSGTVEVDNRPPTIGDVNVTVEKNITTYITMDMIRDLSDPRYSDPDGDAISNVGIQAIDLNNIGEFYYNNLPIFAGQIISAADIDANLFKYVGYDYLSNTPDNFDFVVQDTYGNWSN